MLTITTSLRPNTAFVALAFDNLGMSIKSLREPIKQAVVEVAIPAIEANFDEEYAFGHGSWEDLSEHTVKQREKLGFSPSHPILQRTGELRRAATAQARWNISGNLGAAGAEVNWSSFPNGPQRTKEKAARLHFGDRGLGREGFTPRRSNFERRGMGMGPSIPARPFMALRPSSADKIQQVFSNWVAMRIATQPYMRRWGAQYAGSRARQAEFLTGSTGRVPSFLGV